MAVEQEVSMKTSWQAVAVIGIAVLAILLIVVAAFHWLPGPVSKDQTDNTTGAVTGIAGAALTAIGSAIGAFFGIRAASNAADQAQTTAIEAQKATTEAQKQTRVASAQLAEVSGVGDSNDVQDALKRGAETAQSMG
jgi:hypothetical protein